LRWWRPSREITWRMSGGRDRGRNISTAKLC